MALFEELPIVEYIPSPVYVNNPNNAALTAALKNLSGTCNGDNTYDDDRPGCDNNGGEWENDFTWSAVTNNKVINLDLITSFQEGIRTFDDPAGAWTTGDANPAETFITLGGVNKQFLISQSFNDFRSRMAKLF